MDGAIAFIFIIAILCFYFLPAMISAMRHSEHSTGIFWLNLLFGWTVLGWLACVIWACTEKEEQRAVTDETTAKSPAEWLGYSVPRDESPPKRRETWLGYSVPRDESDVLEGISKRKRVF